MPIALLKDCTYLLFCEKKKVLITLHLFHSSHYDFLKIIFTKFNGYKSRSLLFQFYFIACWEVKQFPSIFWTLHLSSFPSLSFLFPSFNLSLTQFDLSEIGHKVQLAAALALQIRKKKSPLDCYKHREDRDVDCFPSCYQSS